MVGFETVGRFITHKLPKLYSLELGFHLTDKTKFLIELPHLKSLEIHDGRRRINSALQKLSDKQAIEKLTIQYGDFENADVEPIIFNKLTCLRLCGPSGNLFSFVKAEMSAIQTLNMGIYDRTEMLQNDLMKFIESKKSLKSIALLYNNANQLRFVLIRQIIGILKEPCTPKRPFLNLKIRPVLRS